MRQIRAGKKNTPYQMDCVGTETLDPSWPEAQQQRHANGDDGDEHYLDDDDDEDDKTDIWDDMENRVPFGAVILIFLGYIGLGAFMFSRFEEWPMVQSIYFCYITLATVGFGDYVREMTFQERISMMSLMIVGTWDNVGYDEWFTFRLGITLHSLRLSHLGHVFRLDQGRYRG
jgi:hypothetical protein